MLALDALVALSLRAAGSKRRLVERFLHPARPPHEQAATRMSPHMRVIVNAVGQPGLVASLRAHSLHIPDQRSRRIKSWTASAAAQAMGCWLAEIRCGQVGRFFKKPEPSRRIKYLRDAGSRGAERLISRAGGLGDQHEVGRRCSPARRGRLPVRLPCRPKSPHRG